MIQKQLIIVGGGPSGLCAAKTALDAGLSVLLIERNPRLGGQLIKQTHKFFGSESQYAKTRGYDIASILIKDIINHHNLEVLTNTHVIGLYEDKVITTYDGNIYQRYQADAIIVGTGASEKFLAFENNDLPGIYGAGAVQTLMNNYGVLPGNEIVMIGSGNIGLIVSYQLIQAGVKIKAIVEALPNIGGYKVHASKIKRLGVNIMTKTTIKRAIGKDKIEAVELIKLDENWNQIIGSEEIIAVDALCISVGLSPMHQLLSMVNVDTKYVPELGGIVPVIDHHHMTSMPGIFSCGDSVGIEEASSAMMEGYLTGLYVAQYLNHKHPNEQTLMEHLHKELGMLRDGPFGIKTKLGLEKLREGLNDVK